MLRLVLSLVGMLITGTDRCSASLVPFLLRASPSATVPFRVIPSSASLLIDCTAELRVLLPRTPFRSHSRWVVAASQPVTSSRALSWDVRPSALHDRHQALLACEEERAALCVWPAHGHFFSVSDLRSAAPLSFFVFPPAHSSQPCPEPDAPAVVDGYCLIVNREHALREAALSEREAVPLLPPLHCNLSERPHAAAVAQRVQQRPLRKTTSGMAQSTDAIRAQRWLPLLSALFVAHIVGLVWLIVQRTERIERR